MWKNKKNRAPDKQRYVEKLWSPEVYQNYSDQDFKSEMRFNPDTFNYILDAIYGFVSNKSWTQPYSSSSAAGLDHLLISNRMQLEEISCLVWFVSPLR